MRCWEPCQLLLAYVQRRTIQSLNIFRPAHVFFRLRAILVPFLCSFLLSIVCGVVFSPQNSQSLVAVLVCPLSMSDSVNFSRSNNQSTTRSESSPSPQKERTRNNSNTSHTPTLATNSEDHGTRSDKETDHDTYPTKEEQLCEQHAGTEHPLNTRAHLTGRTSSRHDKKPQSPKGCNNNNDTQATWRSPHPPRKIRQSLRTLRTNHRTYNQPTPQQIHPYRSPDITPSN